MATNEGIFRLTGEESQKVINDIWLKFVFTLVAYWAFAIGLPMIKLLEITGRFKEIDLEPFPKNHNNNQIGMFVVTNHPDGGEWFFIYRRFFEIIQLIAPWIILRNFPLALVDRKNFYANNSIKFFQPALVPVDRGGGGELSRSASLKKLLRLLKNGATIVNFFEGTRTGKAVVLLCQNGRKLGKLQESLGLMAKLSGAVVKPGWFEYQGSSLSSLPLQGGFDLKIFLLWYWRLLIGRNGRVILTWGKAQTFTSQSRQEITESVEQYLLELADQV